MSAVPREGGSPSERLARALRTTPEQADELFSQLDMGDIERAHVTLAASSARPLNPKLDPAATLAIGISYGLAIGLSLAQVADSPDEHAPGVDLVPEGMGV